MKGDILVLCPDSEYWPDIRMIVREGSPSRIERLGGFDVTVSAGDGELLGYFIIHRNWGVPEIRLIRNGGVAV